MCICEFIVAIVGSTTASNVSHIVLIVCIYFFFFASTWGPTGWAVSGEVFPPRIRGKGIALSTASNWLWNFVISFYTPYIVDPEHANLGSKVFFIWGGTCAACVAFACLCVYESKGLSLEQIDVMVNEVAPMNSSKWKPHGEMLPPPAGRDISGGSPNLNGVVLGGTGSNEEDKKSPNEVEDAKKLSSNAS